MMQQFSEGEAQSSSGQQILPISLDVSCRQTPAQEPASVSQPANSTRQDKPIPFINQLDFGAVDNEVASVNDAFDNESIDEIDELYHETVKPDHMLVMQEQYQAGRNAQMGQSNKTRLVVRKRDTAPISGIRAIDGFLLTDKHYTHASPTSR